MRVERVAVESASGVVIHNYYYRQDSDSSKLMVLLPGVRYTVDRPLMHYITQMAYEQGMDVLAVQYYFNITQADFDWEHIATARQDALDAVNEVIGGYQQVIFAAKSLGTPIAASILSTLKDDLHASAIMLTPVQHAVDLLPPHIPALALIGTADRVYEPEMVKERDGLRWLVYDGLNHSLEVSGDWEASVKLLSKILTETADFIAAQLAQR